MTKNLTTTNFRTEFKANPEILSKALNLKIRHITIFSSFIEERINIEQTFTRSLQKLLGRDFNFGEGSTLEEGFTKLKIDFGNEHGERTTYVENLTTDILPQLYAFRDKYTKVVKTISEQLTSQGKKYRAQYKSWDKTKTRFHRSCEEARSAKNKLLQIATENKTKKNTDVVKLGKRVNQTLRAQQEWEKKFANEDIKYRKLQNEIESTVDSALYKYQELEIERINCLKDILRKMLVYGVNFIRNRQYDINNIAEVMEKINAESDLLEIIEKLKKKKTKHSSIVPPAPAELEIPMISVNPDSPITTMKPASVPQIVPVPPIVRKSKKIPQISWVLSGTDVWREAVIVEEKDGKYLIHYKGFHKKYDLWLPTNSKRISHGKPEDGVSYAALKLNPQDTTLTTEVISAQNQPKPIIFKPVAVEKIETKLEPASIPLPSPTQIEEKIKKSDQIKTPIQHKLIVDPSRSKKFSTKEEPIDRGQPSNERRATSDSSPPNIHPDAPDPRSPEMHFVMTLSNPDADGTTSELHTTEEDNPSMKNNPSIIIQGGENAI